MFLIFFAYGKFGSHGRFAIYWISRNNGPQYIGATLYNALLANLLFLFVLENMGTHWKGHITALLMSTHNIYFHGEIRKTLYGYHHHDHLPGAVVSVWGNL